MVSKVAKIGENRVFKEKLKQSFMMIGSERNIFNKSINIILKIPNWNNKLMDNNKL